MPKFKVTKYQTTHAKAEVKAKSYNNVEEAADQIESPDWDWSVELPETRYIIGDPDPTNCPVCGESFDEETEYTDFDTSHITRHVKCENEHKWDIEYEAIGRTVEEDDEPICFVAPKPPTEQQIERQHASRQTAVTVEIQASELEKHRATWAKVAKEHDWYTEPFHIQAWIFADGRIQDSVSYTALGTAIEAADLFVLVEPDEEAEYEGEVMELRTLRPEEIVIK